MCYFQIVVIFHKEWKVKCPDVKYVEWCTPNTQTEAYNFYVDQAFYVANHSDNVYA